MSWFKVDDGFLTHPKVFGIKPGPLALWLRAGLWCAKELTDGVMSARAVKALEAKPAHIQELVERGLWEPHGDGFRIHNFLKYQPSRDQVLKTRNETLQRVRKHRNAVTNADVTPAPGPVPVPVKISSVNQDAETETSVPALKPVAPASPAGRASRLIFEATTVHWEPMASKWRNALIVLGGKPDSEWRLAAPVLRAEALKPKLARAVLNPEHILAHWSSHYSIGQAPGGRDKIAANDTAAAPRYAYRDAANGGA